jgi:hypothetical protein
MFRPNGAVAHYAGCLWHAVNAKKNDANKIKVRYCINLLFRYHTVLLLPISDRKIQESVAARSRVAAS